MEAVQTTLSPDAECSSSPNTNHVIQRKHTMQQDKPPASCQNSSDEETRTGNYIMESRMPAESANSTNFTNPQINTTVTAASTDQLYPSTSKQPPCNQYPVAPKRQRVTSSREAINDKAQQLINEINEKRKADTVMLTDFKKAMEMQVARSCGIIEQSMYQMYEHNGKVMQAKLQELFATLDRIAKLEVELQEFKKALGALYTDIQSPS